MAKGLLKNYTFNVAAKTITLTDVTTVRLDKIALITDVTTNKILYNFADLSVATATVATNVITLSALQGGEANGDKLRIDYDVESTDTSAFADTTAPVSAASLPLPSGASTSALQTTGNTSVASIDTKTPALGQALAAASVPVVLTASQLTTLTPPAQGLTDTQLRASAVPVTANAGTNLNTSALALDATLTGGTTKAINRGGAKGSTTAADVTSVSVDANTQALHTSVTNFPASQAVTGTFWQATQPVSGTVTANAGTNLNTSLLALDSTVAKDASITTTNTEIGIVTETAPATDTASSGLNGRLQRVAQRITSLIALLPTALGAGGGLKVDGSGTALPISGTVTTTPPSNASTNVAQINGVTPLMGNGVTGTGSQRVTIASDQTAFSVNANAGTNLNTSALALSATQTDRTQKSQITDGTRDGTVKAASTAAVAADTALVVAISPNNTVPVSLSSTTVTGNVTVVQPTGTNLHAVLDANSGVDIGKLTANQSVNVAQVNGVATSTGTGVMGTGVQRVAIASDNDALTVKQATGTNLHVVLDTTSTTAVTQATAANLNATVVGTKTNNNAAPGATNIGTLSAIANDVVPAYTEGNQVAPSVDLKGRTRTITDITNLIPILENTLLEIQAFNVNAGITASPVNILPILDNNGRQTINVANSRGRIRTATLTLSASTTETTLVPSVPGEVHDLLAIWIVNTSAATSTRVDIRDATGGLLVYPFYSVGGAAPTGISLGGVAIPQQSGVGQAWTAQCATSTTDVRITMVYSVNNI